ncbi:MAG: aldehyde ferredoxin oxidoreductase family protein [archaeon]
MSKILRVDMATQKVKKLDLPEKYKNRGGRWLTDSFILDEVDPECHPLGPNNKLIFAPGMVTGTRAPSSGRISVGAKSPLTGGIKEANAGTPFAEHLARLGYRALVFENRPENKGDFYQLNIDKNGATLSQVNEGLHDKLSVSYDKLREEHGEDISIASIGTAGVQGLAASGICYSDAEGRASRYAGRGGLGAVMGSKGLKYIILDETDAPGVDIKNRELFNEGRKKLAKALGEHDVTKKGGTLNSYGTSALINVLNEAGGLPTNNFRYGRFEGAEKISGETIAKVCEERGGAGAMGHHCHPSCVVGCSNIYPREDGSEYVSCIEYESDWALGANCGIDDLDKIAEMVLLCNEYGLDTIEMGGTIAVAMEGGLAEFGDGDKAIALLKEVGEGSALGKLLGSGAAVTGKAMGVERVPAVKGQNMPAYEPRAVKGIGYVYATSTMGADHTAGYTIAPEILGVGGEADPLETDKAELARGFQDTTAFIDSSGYCLFIAFAILDIAKGFEGVVDTVNAVLGTSWDNDRVAEIGSEIMEMEREFNKKAGFTKADDRLPEFMKYEKLPPHDEIWNVSDEQLDKVFK